jgi:hypothetical protein
MGENALYTVLNTGTAEPMLTTFGYTQGHPTWETTMKFEPRNYHVCKSTFQSGESGGPICKQVYNPVNEQGPFKSCNSSVASRKLQSIVQTCEERTEAE